MSEPRKTRVPCQVCGRALVPLADGTARRHGRWGDCSGSGYRLALWPVGQRLAHYAGAVFEVVSVHRYGGPSHQWMSEYVMRCVSDPFQTSGVERGKTSTFHGEYLHRHGWTPVRGG